MPASLCITCGEQPVHGQGRCRSCYSLAFRAGEITRTRTARTSPRDFLLSRVAAGYGGCWVFTGTVTRNGYGSMVDIRTGRTSRAHRVAYEVFIGPIADGLHIDHLCRNRRCVNPRHLEAVSQRENTLRGESFSARNALKTHCAQGHEYTPENTYYRTPTHRQCRRCTAIWQAAYYRRKRAARS